MKTIKTKTAISEELADIAWDIDVLLDNVNTLRLKIQEEYSDGSMIYDTENFIRELNSAGLYSKEMQEFMANYIRFNNEPK